jgi:hypothetical protein
VTSTPNPGDRTLPAGAADRLLARAAELDAAPSDGLRVGELRAAATEAGSSARGLDAALTELNAPGRAQPPAGARGAARDRGRPPSVSRRWS